MRKVNIGIENRYPGSITLGHGIMQAIDYQLLIRLSIHLLIYLLALSV